MRREVTAFSHHEHIVLYDPAAIPPDTPIDPDLGAQEPVPLPGRARSELTDHGLALLLRIASDDCQATLRVLVDETPEPFLQERAVRGLDGAVLRLPGGRLTIDGIEFLCRAGETREHSEGESFEVPAGEYAVEVLNLMPWKEQYRSVEINKRTTKFDRLVDKLTQAYTWLFIALIPANILLAPAMILLVFLLAGWRQALMAAVAVVVVDVLVVAGFWIEDAASRVFPALRRARNARDEFETENPDVVVCLQKAVHVGDRQVPAMATLEVR